MTTSTMLLLRPDSKCACGIRHFAVTAGLHLSGIFIRNYFGKTCKDYWPSYLCGSTSRLCVIVWGVTDLLMWCRHVIIMETECHINYVLSLLPSICLQIPYQSRQAEARQAGCGLLWWQSSSSSWFSASKPPSDPPTFPPGPPASPSPGRCPTSR